MSEKQARKILSTAAEVEAAVSEFIMPEIQHFTKQQKLLFFVALNAVITKAMKADGCFKELELEERKAKAFDWLMLNHGKWIMNLEAVEAAMKEAGE